MTRCGSFRISDTVSQFLIEHADTPTRLRARNKPMNPRTEWSWRRAQVNAFGMALEIVNA
jgi:hypothetical protein